MAKPEGKGRPTNEELYNKEPDLEPGTEQAVAAVQTANPQITKMLESEILSDDASMTTGYEVTGGWQDNPGMESEVTHIVEYTLDADCQITGQEERPADPPGQAKKQ